MKVTVVIPAYNEESCLRRCLECLENQTLSKDEFEVILVDNGSTDSTVRIGEGFASKINIQVASKAKGSISEVRNHGVSLSSGEIIAFLDADCLAPKHWLLEAINRKPQDSLWGAHYSIPEDASWVSRSWFEYQAKARDGAVSFLPAGDLFISRPDFFRLGGFDESMQTSEDVDLCSRASAIGLNVVSLPMLAVIHEGSPKTLAGFFRQNRWHGRHVLKAFLRNLPSLRNLHIVAITLYTLLIFWIMIVATIAAFVWGFWIFPFVLLGFLLLPPLAFSFYKTEGKRSVRSIISLWILYTTFLLARAAALCRSMFPD